MRFRAGVLSYVLAIGILVSAGLSMLILYLYYSRLEYKDYERRIRLLTNLETAEEICKAEHSKLEYDEVYFYDLYERGIDSISIAKRKWGLLDIYETASFDRKVKYERAFMLGHYPTEKGRSAVYLPNERGVLSVVGDTKLTGDCYLPSAGVQSAYINRIGYTNEELIYGEELVSEKDFPEANLESVFEDLESLKGVDISLSDSIYSFTEGPEVIEKTSFDIFEEIGGNLILKSDGRIRFKKESRTTDIVVFGSVIEFEEGFTGSGQFFASDTIIVGKGVTLSYPSSIAVYNPTKPAQIYLKEDSEVSGWLLMQGSKSGFRRRVIFMEDDSKVTGMIYCDGMMEIYGEVSGNVTARKFLVNVPRGVYENYLFNAQIDATTLPLEFLTLKQWFFSDSTEVLKYLN